MSAPQLRSDQSDIVVTVEPFPSVPNLAVIWRELESRAAPSFFLSWTWIGTWLEVTQLEPAVVVARSSGRLVGLSLLNETRRGSLGLRWQMLSLNEAGRSEQDCIMIEDNGFLAETGMEARVTSSCLGYLVSSMPDWRELRLSGVPKGILETARSLHIPVRIEAERPSYFVDIGPGSVDGGLTHLSRNTRQQINRSARLYQVRGEVTLRRSATLDEGLARFSELEELHQRRWRAKGKPGAFAAPFFGQFHRALLTRGFAAGQVDVLRVAAASQTVGLLYTFFYGDGACAYQSGFEFESDPRLKPGLVSHHLAIESCREMGLRRYRLLAGDSRYKRSLATGSYELYWLSIRRPDFAFHVEKLARKVTGREP